MNIFQTIIMLTLVLAGFVLADAAHAQSLKKFDTSQPIEITADALEVLQKEQKAVFKGNVLAKQGVLQLTSDSMVVHYHTTEDNKQESDQAVSRIEVVGNVFLATPEESARGHRGIYDVDGNVIKMRGDVVLTKGKSVIKGDKLDYDLETGLSHLVGDQGVSQKETGEPSATGGRVRGLFVPEKKKE